MDHPALPVSANPGSLPTTHGRFHWLVFPFLSALTVLVMLCLSEIASRLVWSEGGVDSCITNDPHVGERNKPNCSARLKDPEGEWVEYRYNDCGYRTSQPCGMKPLGAIRVALMGASTTEGNMSPYDRTFSAVAARDLSDFYNRPVEFQNMGTSACMPICSYRRLDEALRLKPDLVLCALAPYDVHEGVDPAALSARNDPLRTLPPQTKLAPSSFIERLAAPLPHSRAVLAARHFLYQDGETYVKLYLLQNDKAGFLRQPFSNAWEKRFSDINVLLGDMAEKCRASGVPFAVAALPERAQVALLRRRDLQQGITPYAFRDRLALIARNHGIIFLDVLSEFSQLPKPETLFFPADGHLTPDGQTLYGHAIARGLETSSLAVFTPPKPRNPQG